jgi:4-amino-4-deoxy-L-arabinose transferase-like glycosyltransferase
MRLNVSKIKIAKIKIACLCCLLLGSVFRIYNLGANSLWTDEAGFIMYRNGDLLESLKHIFSRIKQGEMANLGYSFFVTAWSYFFGSEFMLRLSSVIFGILCIVLIYHLGKELFNEKTGLISAFILAISPFHIYYSQEFRMYILVTLLTMVSVYSLTRFLQTKNSKFLVSYTISNSLNIYFHFATSLILLSQAVFLFMYARKYKDLLKRWMFVHLAVILFISPLIIHVIRYFLRFGGWNCSISTCSVLGHLSLPIVFFTFKNFSAGYNATWQLYLPLLVLFIGLSFWGIFKGQHKQGVILCLCCLSVPVFTMYLLQRFVYADRYLLPSSIFLYLLVAYGLSKLEKKYAIVITILISVLCFFSLVNYYNNYLPGELDQRIAVHSRKDHRNSAAYLIKNFQDGDIIFHSDVNTVLPLQYYFNYFKGDTKSYSYSKFRYNLVLRFPENSTEIAPFKVWDELFWEKFRKRADFISVCDHKRVWLFFSAREYEQALRPESYEKKILKWIERCYNKVEEKNFQGITLYLLSKKDQM